MVTPQQPKGMLHTQRYVAFDNPLLELEGMTRFPIIPLINGYAKQGEHVQVITVTYGAPSNCAHNLQLLQAELEELEREIGAKIELVSVDVPFDDSVVSLIHTYQLLIDNIDDGDTLYACITFGSKPMSLMLTMALQYGYRIRKNVFIDCIVYGQIDWSTSEPVARIYDVTALAKIDEMVRLLADMDVPDPETTLKLALGIGEESDV